MGHHDGGASGHQGLQGLLNPLLRLGVDVGRSLVQNEDGRVKGQSPGEADELPLSGGEGGAPLRNPLVVARRQLLDEAAGVDLPGRPDHVLVGDGLAAQADVALDIPGEEEHVLLHLSDGGADLVPGHVLDIDAVDENLPPLHVVIPADQVQDGALARAGGPHEGHLLPRLDDKAHVPEDIVLPIVGEPHVLELNPPPDLRRTPGLRRIVDLGLLVQEREYLLRRGHRRLEGGELLRQILDGLEEGLDVL